VGFEVVLSGFAGVVRGVHLVSMGHLRVMRRRFVVAFLMVLGSFFVVVGGMLMMLGCLVMMVRCFLRHKVFLSLARFRDASLGLASIVNTDHCVAVSKA
jgi:hypothetical protein